MSNQQPHIHTGRSHIFRYTRKWSLLISESYHSKNVYLSRIYVCQPICGYTIRIFNYYDTFVIYMFIFITGIFLVNFTAEK